MKGWALYREWLNVGFRTAQDVRWCRGFIIRACGLYGKINFTRFSLEFYRNVRRIVRLIVPRRSLTGDAPHFLPYPAYSFFIEKLIDNSYDEVGGTCSATKCHDIFVLLRGSGANILVGIWNPLLIIDAVAIIIDAVITVENRGNM